MSSTIAKMLQGLNIEPVLVDVGACGATPEQWTELAPFSTYIGFDPDARALREPTDSGFRRATIFNCAVTERADATTVEFNLAKSHPCSSVLPCAPALTNYMFADLFEVERRVVAPAITLNDALRKRGLTRIDWLKLDTQGTDLRLFLSLESKIRSRVLAVDVEPGLIDVYQGEDLFAPTHMQMQQEGFWLSSLKVKGTVRIRRRTFEKLRQEHAYLIEKDIYRGIRDSPGWCEARYLRSLKHMAEVEATEQEYALLWCFALTEKQRGYALDIAEAFRSSFGPSALANLLREVPLRSVRRSRWRIQNIVKRCLPRGLKAVLYRILNQK